MAYTYTYGNADGTLILKDNGAGHMVALEPTGAFAAEYAQAQAGDFGPVAPYVPPPEPPPDLPGALAAHYRATRDGGTTIEGMAVQTDEGSRGLINGAVARAILRGTPERTFTFKAPTGAVIITDAQIMGIGMAVADHVQACIDAEAAVSAVLDDYDTEAEVQAAFDAAYAAAGGPNG